MCRLEKKIDIKGGDTTDAFAGRIFGSLANQEGRLVLKLPAPQTVEFYKGLKIFYQYDAEAHAGNCVACHHPPTFTDFQFHNTGVTQDEYDGVHGDGAFVKMAIPSSNAKAGDKTRTSAAKDDPAKADLGYWNFGESDLGSAIGAFKTPGLTDVDKTAPYGHNGQYATLEEVIRQYMKASNLAREGKLRNAPEAYKWMFLSEEDIAPLVAFLKAMTEVGPDQFRSLVTDNLTVMKAPYPFSE
jgi:cytochrome c peroxidase